METFDGRVDTNAQRRFFAWREGNPRAFVLNRQGAESMVHVAACGHLAPFTKFEANFVKNPKVCSESFHELANFARQVVGFEPLTCPDCKPLGVGR